jgi:hypothetical protein
MVDFETGVYAGNTGKCGSGIPSTVDCTSTGENANPSVTFDIVTTLFKHNGVDHWALKTGNAKSGRCRSTSTCHRCPRDTRPSNSWVAWGWVKVVRATPTAPAASPKAPSWRVKRPTPPTTPFRRAS